MPFLPNRSLLESLLSTSSSSDVAVDISLSCCLSYVIKIALRHRYVVAIPISPNPARLSVLPLIAAL